MQTIVTSTIIGELKQNGQLTDWWEGDAIKIPFFDNLQLPITFTGFDPEQDLKFIQEADNALLHFFKLDTSDKNAISILAYKNCMEFLADVGYDAADEALYQITEKNEIWKYIYPTAIYVQRRYYHDQNVYIQVACECAWEQEHGLQFVFRQGKKLTRISDQDGHLTAADAYGKSDEEDELLSKF